MFLLSFSGERFAANELVNGLRQLHSRSLGLLTGENYDIVDAAVASFRHLCKSQMVESTLFARMVIRGWWFTTKKFRSVKSD